MYPPGQCHDVGPVDRLFGKSPIVGAPSISAVVTVKGMLN
jgi:hypothetical protein